MLLGTDVTHKINIHSIKQPPTQLIGLGTASPIFSYSQKEILEFILTHFNLKDRTKALYRKTFSNPSIERRHFALKSLHDILDTNPDHIHQRFQKEAIHLSVRSLEAALAQAEMNPTDIDFLAVATCTGYLCPGLSSYVLEKVGLRTDIPMIDLVGMGCGAVLPSLVQAHQFVQTHPGSTAAVIATEICSCAFYSNDAPDIIITNSLFSDGSAALLLKSERGNIPSTASLLPKILEFETMTLPQWRDDLKFEFENGYLKNVLGINIPQQSAQSLKTVTDRLMGKFGMTRSDISHWIVHAGGEKILNEFEGHLSLSPHHLKASRHVLKQFGNMSSATVLYVLDAEISLNKPRKGDLAILASFGAGFSTHAALVEF